MSKDRRVGAETSPPPARNAIWQGLIVHAVVVGSFYCVDGLCFGQGAWSGILAFIMVVVGLLHVVRGLFADHRRALYGAAVIGLYVMMMAAVVATIRAQNRLAHERVGQMIATLERYRADHGTFPAKLADLVPDYMPSVTPAKDTMLFNTFMYSWSEDRGGFLLYAVFPPFGRRIYDLKTGEWSFLD